MSFRLRFPALAAAGALALGALASTPAQATWLRTFDNTPATATAAALGTPITFGGPQPNATDAYDVLYQYYTLAVPATSTLTITVQAPPANEHGKTNDMIVHLAFADDSATLRDVLGQGAAEADSATTTTVTNTYKVLAGTYLLKGQGYTSDNGYGIATVTATPVADDPGGEPNDTTVTAKPVALDTDYSGNIAYYGKLNGASWSNDWYDYYSFTVPSNNYGLDLTFSRVADDTNKNLQAQILNANGGSVGSTISTANAYSGTLSYTFDTAGTYFLKVNGYALSANQGTEYSFRLTPVPPPTLTTTASVTLAKGKTAQITAVVSPAGRTLTWTTSNASVATVSTSGLVTAVGPGTATITAVVNDASFVTASTTVKVTSPVTKVSLNKKKATVKKGKKLKLKATIAPSDATPKKLTWTTSNKKIATVSAKGVVTAKKKGKVTITVKAPSGKKATAKITVK